LFLVGANIRFYSLLAGLLAGNFCEELL